MVFGNCYDKKKEVQQVANEKIKQVGKLTVFVRVNWINDCDIFICIKRLIKVLFKIKHTVVV